jgi:hypothetical protein
MEKVYGKVVAQFGAKSFLQGENLVLKQQK